MKAILLSLIFTSVFFLGGCDTAQNSSEEESDAVNAASEMKKSVDEGIPEGLQCSQAMGDVTRNAYLGIVEFENKKVMATRISMSIPDVPISLLHDNGDTVVAYMFSDVAKQGTFFEASDASSFDGDRKDYFSSAKYTYGDCKSWKLDSGLLIPPSDYEFTESKHN